MDYVEKARDCGGGTVTLSAGGWGLGAGWPTAETVSANMPKAGVWALPALSGHPFSCQMLHRGYSIAALIKQHGS